MPDLGDDEDQAVAAAGKSPADRVFTMPGGGPLRHNNWGMRYFAPACGEAGPAGVTPHDLRHTAASLAVAVGADVKVVRRMLGHASAAMTLDIYAGLFANDLDAVAERPDLLAGQGAGSGGRTVDASARAALSMA
jgi:integrase